MAPKSLLERRHTKPLWSLLEAFTSHSGAIYDRELDVGWQTIHRLEKTSREDREETKTGRGNIRGQKETRQKRILRMRQHKAHNRKGAWQFMRECDRQGIKAGYPYQDTEGTWTVNYIVGEV